MHLLSPTTYERCGECEIAGQCNDADILPRVASLFYRIFFTISWFTATAIPALANVGPISVGGQVVAEPIAIKNISITRETLNIDLRPTVDHNPALVEATYQLQNTGPAARHRLLFASGTNGDNQYVITLDDTVLTSEAITLPLPAEWKPPKVTPGISGLQGLEYSIYFQSSGETKSVAFTAMIQPGAHTLKVRYSARVGTNFSGEPLMYHQFSYILAPAKSWESFGGLDVTIQYPKGWNIACTPKMTQDGDVLRGSFTGVPADAIAITIQAPTPPEYERYRELSKILFIAVVLIGPIFCSVFGYRVGHRAASSAAVGLTGVALGIMAAAAVAAAGWAAVYGVEIVLPKNQITRYGYGEFMAVFGIGFLVMIMWIIGTMLAVVIGLSVFKKKKSLVRQ